MIFMTKLPLIDFFHKIEMSLLSKIFDNRHLKALKNNSQWKFKLLRYPLQYLIQRRKYQFCNLIK